MTPSRRKTKSKPDTERDKARASVIKRIILMEIKKGRPPSEIEINRDYPLLAKKIRENFKDIAEVRIAVALEQTRLDNETAPRK